MWQGQLTAEYETWKLPRAGWRMLIWCQNARMQSQCHQWSGWSPCGGAPVTNDPQISSLQQPVFITSLTRDEFIRLALVLLYVFLILEPKVMVEPPSQPRAERKRAMSEPQDDSQISASTGHPAGNLLLAGAGRHDKTEVNGEGPYLLPENTEIMAMVRETFIYRGGKKIGTQPYDYGASLVAQLVRVCLNVGPG